MGCRVAAFVTLLVIIGLDLLSNIAAVPSPHHVAEARAEARASAGRYRRAAAEDDVVPVHRKQLKEGDQFPLTSGKYGGFGLEAYSFQAPDDTRLSIEFSDIEFQSYTDDTLTAYSGIVPNAEFGKSKTTAVGDGIQRKEFREQLARLPFLFSTKDPSDTFQEHALINLNQRYFSDSNELTVAFDHTNFGKGYTALVQVHKVIETGGMSSKHSRRNGGVPPQGSFDLCEEQGVQTGPIERGTGGTIRSHAGYPDSDMKEFVSTTCMRTINLDSGRIQLDIQSMGLTSGEVDCETAYLEVTDLGNESKKPVRFCDNSHQGKKYEFSNNIQLVLYPGDWGFDVMGFQIMYSALKQETEPSDTTELAPDRLPDHGVFNTDGDQDETGKEVTWEVTSTKNKSETPEPEKPAIIAGKIGPASKKTNKQAAQPLPAIFIVSVIVVAILLIIILSAAGAIACYRTHQQEQVINSLTERMIQDTNESERSGEHAYVDGSNGSLCTGCHQAGVSVTRVVLDSSKNSIVQQSSLQQSPLASGIDIARRGRPAQYVSYDSNEATKLIASSPSTSEEYKVPDSSESSAIQIVEAQANVPELCGRSGAASVAPVIQAINNQGNDYIIQVQSPPK